MTIKFIGENGKDTFDQGDTITIEGTFKESLPFDDDQTLTDPDQIELTIKGFENNIVVDQVDMTKNDTGEYFFNWDTSEVDAGDYEVEVQIFQEGAEEVEKEWIKLN